MAEEIQKKNVADIGKETYNNGVVLGVQNGKAVTYGVNEAGGLVTTDKVDANLTFGKVEKGDTNVVSGGDVYKFLSNKEEKELPVKNTIEGFIRNDGEIENNEWWKIRVFDYIDGDVYLTLLTGEGGYNVVHYFDADGKRIGYELPINGDIQFKDKKLNVPKKTSYFYINTGVNNETLELTNVIVGDIYDFGQIEKNKKEIQIINEKTKIDRLMKVSIFDNYFTIRTEFDIENDIIIKYVYGVNNGNITPTDTYFGLKTQTDDEILNTQAIHHTWDSTGPIWMPEYEYLFAQHGYPVPTLTTSNTQDVTIGSKWKDDNNNEYTIGKIEGSKIWLLPVIIKGDIEGDDTRGWKDSSNNNYSKLIHINGSVNTSDITPISKSFDQLRPITRSENVTFLADNSKVGKGVFYCDEFTASETIYCANPVYVKKWFPDVVFDETMCDIVQSFTFIGLTCAVNSILKSNYPIKMSYYGANQAIMLNARDSDEISFVVIPKIKDRQIWGYLRNFSKPVDVYSSNNTLVINKSEEHLKNTEDMPDRCISILNKNYNSFFGFASGFSLTRGLTKKGVWADNIPSDMQVSAFSPNVSNKFYPRVLNGYKNSNMLLPKNFIGEVNYYFSYFKPQGDVFPYVYKDGNKWCVYIHFERETEIDYVNLPKILEGKTFEILENTNSELLTTTVQNGKLFFKSTSNNGDYLVLIEK